MGSGWSSARTARRWPPSTPITSSGSTTPAPWSSWAATTPIPIATCTGSLGWVSGLAYSADGDPARRRLARRNDRVVQVLDPATYEPVAVQPGGQPHRHSTRTTSSSAPTGATWRSVWTCSVPQQVNDRVYVWDLTRPRQPLHRIELPIDSSHIEFTRQWAAALRRPRVALGRRGTGLWVYDVRTGKQVDRRSDGGHGLELSPDGRTLAYGLDSDVVLSEGDHRYRPAQAAGAARGRHPDRLLAGRPPRRGGVRGPRGLRVGRDSGRLLETIPLEAHALDVGSTRRANGCSSPPRTGSSPSTSPVRTGTSSGPGCRPGRVAGGLHGPVPVAVRAGRRGLGVGPRARDHALRSRTGHRPHHRPTWPWVARRRVRLLCLVTRRPTPRLRRRQRVGCGSSTGAPGQPSPVASSRSDTSPTPPTGPASSPDDPRAWSCWTPAPCVSTTEPVSLPGRLIVHTVVGPAADTAVVVSAQNTGAVFDLVQCGGPLAGHGPADGETLREGRLHEPAASMACRRTAPGWRRLPRRRGDRRPAHGRVGGVHRHRRHRRVGRKRATFSPDGDCSPPQAVTAGQPARRHERRAAGHRRPGRRRAHAGLPRRPGAADHVADGSTYVWDTNPQYAVTPPAGSSAEG